MSQKAPCQSRILDLWITPGSAGHEEARRATGSSSVSAGSGFSTCRIRHPGPRLRQTPDPCCIRQPFPCYIRQGSHQTRSKEPAWIRILPDVVSVTFPRHGRLQTDSQQSSFRITGTKICSPELPGQLSGETGAGSPGHPDRTGHESTGQTSFIQDPGRSPAQDPPNLQLLRQTK